ncbi:hypothetical protein [Nonomuraea gerenzanensis]|uniref:Uncharacterized protein n=1 Tax=Nonomuraea gerenzanensis TaxID=93944 RepID=A0A1M4E1P9_9ACTN|nr:hypothetical protein [Nonomuraea gerenzanensis]SBO92676.1 hypothetical protein BN4615_P2190 [Nonomuraea gerenzanensis]
MLAEAVLAEAVPVLAQAVPVLADAVLVEAGARGRVTGLSAQPAA